MSNWSVVRHREWAKDDIDARGNALPVVVEY